MAKKRKKKPKKKPAKPKYVEIAGEKIYVRKGETPNQARARHMQRIKKDSIVASLRQGSTRSAAAQGAGIDRATFYRWLAQDTEFANQCTESEAHCVRMVESALYTNALKPEGKVDRIFFLKNRANYSDRRHITGTAPIVDEHREELADGAQAELARRQGDRTAEDRPAPAIDWDDLSDEEIERMAWGDDDAD